jgi:F0F1-type ATP synthase membrane subunit b/b'
MDPTLKALTHLLLQAIPTIVCLIFLTAYLKYIFFNPLRRVLDERHRQTEGVRRLAEEAFAAADGKLSEFERALAAAKMELYREQETQRQKLVAEQTRAIAEARMQAGMRIEEARRELGVEVERATADLALQAHELAKQMIATVLHRKAA